MIVKVGDNYYMANQYIHRGVKGRSVHYWSATGWAGHPVGPERVAVEGRGKVGAAIFAAVEAALRPRTKPQPALSDAERQPDLTTSAGQTEHIVRCTTHGDYLVRASEGGTTWRDDQADARRYPNLAAAQEAARVEPELLRPQGHVLPRRLLPPPRVPQPPVLIGEHDMKETPNMHIGEAVQVTLDAGTWATGTIRFGDASVVKVTFSDYPELDGYYPTEQVELIEKGTR